MKRILLYLLTAVLSLCIVGCSGGTDISTANIKYLIKNTTDVAAASDEYRVIKENENLVLKFNDATTDVCVVDKTNGFAWSTDAKTEDDETLYNIIYLTYRTETGNVGVLSSSNHCISKGQYKAEATENGIKVKYTLGDVATEYIYPETLIPERYDYFYEKCDDDGKYLLESCYAMIDISFYDDVTRKEMNKKYPYAVDGKIYIPTTMYDDMLKSELSYMFREIGYKKEDLKIDHTELKSDAKENIAVNVSIYYSIENDTFMVKIPEKEIEYPDYVHIESMNVLEIFAGATSKNGYFLLPDGSGSIMNFRNNKVAENYRVQIYGQEKTIFSENKLMDLQNAIFPVYGCVSDNNGYFAIIEDGESHCYINAVSGDEKATPRAWIDFTVEPLDYMIADSGTQTGSDQKNAVYQTDRYDGELSIKYKFFANDKANYSEMANYYQNYLFWEKDANKNDYKYPITVQTVGAVRQQKTTLGFNYSDIYTLTTFKQSEKIANDLLKSGVQDVNLILKGWSGKGYEYGYAEKIKLVKSLGGSDDLKSVITNLNKKDISVYLDFDIQYADEEVNNKNIAEMLDESKAVLNIYDKAVFEKIGSSRYILTPNAIAEAMLNAYNFADDFNCGISFSTIGIDLNSDYNTDNTVDRQKAKSITVEKLSEISGKQLISAGGGNAYVLPFINQLDNMAVKSNGHDMTDYSIPFVGMVLSGYVDYSAPILNDSNMEKADLLRIIESNASVSALLTENDTISVDISEYTLPSSTKYDDVKDSIVSSYEYCLEALDGLYGKRIVKHSTINNNVRVLEYENGAKMYINYSNTSVEFDGKKIEPLSWIKEVA